MVAYTKIDHRRQPEIGPNYQMLGKGWNVGNLGALDPAIVYAGNTEFFGAMLFGCCHVQQIPRARNVICVNLYNLTIFEFGQICNIHRLGCWDTLIGKGVIKECGQPGCVSVS